MSRSYRHLPVAKGRDPELNRYGRKRMRAKARSALRGGRIERAPIKPQAASDVRDWADWHKAPWQDEEGVTDDQRRQWFRK